MRPPSGHASKFYTTLLKKKKEQKIMDKSKELQITDCTAIPAIHILPDISSGEN